MWYVIIPLGVLFLLWVLLHLRTSRPDGVHIKRVHPVRRLIPFIMKRSSESVVYFDTVVDAEKLMDYIKETREAFGADITHITVAAAATAIAENPAMNKFVSGYRYYQRKGIWATFSMKRVAMDKKAKIAVVKLEMLPGESLRDLCARVNEQISHQRSGKRTHDDKEYDLFGMIPRPLLAMAVRFFKWLDYHGLLPGFFIEGDGMFTSIFVANLGSLKMGAGYHHLYNWGNCPLFMMIGQLEDRAVVRDGEVVVRPILPIRFTFDERVDDGLTARHGIDVVVRILENPFEELGCLKEDGSDARPLDGTADPIDY